MNMKFEVGEEYIAQYPDGISQRFTFIGGQIPTVTTDAGTDLLSNVIRDSIEIAKI